MLDAILGQETVISAGQSPKSFSLKLSEKWCEHTSLGGKFLVLQTGFDLELCCFNHCLGVSMTAFRWSNPRALWHKTAGNFPLVGGWPTPLKNMSSSVGMMTFPTVWKVIKFHGSKPPTRLNLHFSCFNHHFLIVFLWFSSKRPATGWWFGTWKNKSHVPNHQPVADEIHRFSLVHLYEAGSKAKAPEAWPMAPMMPGMQRLKSYVYRPYRDVMFNKYVYIYIYGIYNWFYLTNLRYELLMILHIYIYVCVFVCLINTCTVYVIYDIYIYIPILLCVFFMFRIYT